MPARKNAPSPEVAKIRSRIAGLRSKGIPFDDPRIVQSRHGLRVAMLDTRIDVIIEAWPDLTDAQVARIVGMLRTRRAS